MPNFIEVECKTACRRLKRFFPYEYDLNVYRGCEHGCRYCYALYSHRYINLDSFFGDIYVKKNIAEVLDRELSKKTWKRDVINIGSVSDSYQQAEAVYKIMPEVLEVLTKHRTPCIISTKSDLILRDFDILAKLAETAAVNVASTITCADENIRKKLEPGAVPSQRRFEMLKAFNGTKVTTGVHFMPAVPFLTDTPQNIERICGGTSECGADYIITGTLNLRGPTKIMFFEFIKKEYPQLFGPVTGLFATGRLDREYKRKFYETAYKYVNAYHLSTDYISPLKRNVKQETMRQLSLFDKL
ncbi:radical SAM protein [Lachnospiraceae bacterium NSJ-143]|nr:radical SAM protein [Lachnospiraceae bacterium NSJ-143]